MNEDNNIRTRIGARIRELRTEKGLSIRALAEITGINTPIYALSRMAGTMPALTRWRRYLIKCWTSQLKKQEPE